MIIGELAQHAGRFCEIATHHGKFFGVLVRLSSAAFLIRPLPGAKSLPHIVAANEVVEVTPLPDSHL
jgi:hypothetical protein